MNKQSTESTGDSQKDKCASCGRTISEYELAYTSEEGLICSECEPPAEAGEAQPVTQQSLKPHRGGLILTFGIIGICCCLPSGIIAWVMGNKDLKEMEAVRMDPSGKGLTLAGKICGLIGVIFLIVNLFIGMLISWKRTGWF